MHKIFISHAVRDKELAELLEDLIETGIGIPHNDIFCTSLEGLGIPNGIDFKQHIQKELEGCDTVVAMISENYYASPFCMCELGAVWAYSKHFFPILVPPLNFTDLRGILPGTQCRKLLDTSMPSALYDCLCKLASVPVPVARFDTKKAAFLDKLPNILKRLPKPDIVRAEEHNRLKDDLDGYKQLSIELEKEKDELQRQLKEIVAAKDATAVAAIVKKYSTEWQQFESLLEDCNRAIGKLTPVIQEAMFFWTRREVFEPNYENWGDQVKRALENDELIEERAESYQFKPNRARPKIDEAMNRIEALRGFLEKCSSEFFEEAKRQLGDTPDITRRDFWQKHVA